jgi:hypothetical protein
MSYLKRASWRGHKNNAKARGIGFFFTYEGWCQWWEDELGPDWYEMRGCRKGQFVMARHLDKGDYRIGNVKCVSQGSNHAECNIRSRGKKHDRWMSRRKDSSRRAEYLRRLEMWDEAFGRMSLWTVDEPG